MSVDELVELVYDVYNPVAEETDTGRRDGAATALRELNPTLPTDSSDISLGTTPWVYLHVIPRTPFRIPKEPQGLRDDLASIGVRNVDAMSGVSITYLMSELPGTPSQSAVERLHGICRLMRVSGMDSVTAAALYDDDITEPADLVKMNPSELKSFVSSHVQGGFPSELLNWNPWNHWRFSARFMTTTSRSRPVSLIPVPLWPSELEPHIDFWRGEAESADRVAESRDSAAAMQWLLELQQDLLKAHVAVRRKESRAIDKVMVVWKKLGAKALELGVVQGGSPEATGPSLNTVMGVTWRVLDALDPEDAKTQVTRAGIRPTNASDGLRAFTINNLLSQHVGNVEGALDGTTCAKDLGLEGMRVLDRAFAEREWGDLLDDLKTDVGVTRSVARVLDFADTDKQNFTRNLRVLGNDKLQNDDAWAAVRAEVSLRSMRAKVGGSLSLSAYDALDRTLDEIEGLPVVLLENMSPFDRFLAFTPNKSTDDTVFYVPLNANFAERYRLDVLDTLLDADDPGEYVFERSDFLDLGRFGMALPFFMAKAFRAATSKAMRLAGHHRTADALMAAALYGSGSSSKEVTRSLRDLPSWGRVKQENFEIDCAAFHRGHGGVGYLHDLNRQGDRAYQAGRLDEAIALYELVLQYDAQCRTGYLRPPVIEEFPNMLQEARDRLENDRPNAVHDQMLKYLVVDTSDPTISEYMFSAVLEEPAYDTYTSVTQTQMSLSTGVDILPRIYATDPIGGLPVSKLNTVTRRDSDVTLESLELDSIPSLPGRGIFVDAYANDYAYEAETFHAAAYREQAKVNLNWLGFDPEMTPPWRFDWLLSQARYFAGKADEYQQRGMSLLASGEGKELQELEAKWALELAGQAVMVADAAAAVADAERAVADKNLEVANNEVDRSKNSKYWAWAVGVGVVAGSILTAGAAGAAALAVAGVALSSSATSAGQISGGTKNHDRAKEAAEVAGVQVDLAADKQTLAGAQLTLATMEEASAQAVYDILTGADLTADVYFEMQAIIERVSTSYLEMATRLAWLAERAYQWETRKSRESIRQCYYDEDVASLRFTGAAALLADLDSLEHTRVTSQTDRSQVIKTTYSLLGHAPASLMQLRKTGACLFQLSSRQLDERFPGLYLHNLRRVEVRVHGLLPSSGVMGVLSTTNTSTIRVPNLPAYNAKRVTVGEDRDWYPSATFPIRDDTTRFVRKQFNAPGFSQVLSQYEKGRDSVVLTLPEGMLDSFQNLAPDVTWLLELPPQANGFDFELITDVEFIYYFTAEYSVELAARQAEVLASEDVERAALLAGSVHAADSLAQFTTTPLDPRFRDIRTLVLDVQEADLAAHLSGRELTNFSFTLAREGNDDLALSVRADAMAQEIVVSTDSTAAEPLDQMVFTAVGDVDVVLGGATVYTSREGTYEDLEDTVSSFEDITGRWVLKVVPEDNPGFLLKDDDGDDVEVTSGTVTLGSSGAKLQHTAGAWKNVRVEASVKPGVSSGLKVHLNDTGTSSVSIELTTGGTCILTDGTTTDSKVVGASLLQDGRWTRLTAQICGGVVSVWLDEALVLESSGFTSSTGTVSFEGPNLEVADVRVTKLRYDGTLLEEEVTETFDADPSVTWTLTNATWATSTHKLLDLSALADVFLQIDYAGQLSFS